VSLSTPNLTVSRIGQLPPAPEAYLCVIISLPNIYHSSRQYTIPILDQLLAFCMFLFTLKNRNLPRSADNQAGVFSASYYCNLQYMFILTVTDKLIVFKWVTYFVCL